MQVNRLEGSEGKKGQSGALEGRICVQFVNALPADKR
jgi:hypothetical protein